MSVDAAQRWHDGDHGPASPMARATKRVCRDCGFMVRLDGALGVMFGVCCNELSADGQVEEWFLEGLSKEVIPVDHMLAVLNLKVASGQHSKSEDLGYGDNEYVPWHVGAMM